jgi:hypothetical protein
MNASRRFLLDLGAAAASVQVPEADNAVKSFAGLKALSKTAEAR